MITEASELGTILGFFAHPDDETYLAAGIMAAAARAGARVVCVTATRGEEGSWDEERWPTATMGKVREAELERCLAILGVTEHHWLDYYDGRCAEVPRGEGVERARSFLRDVRPDTVLTFGPEGMTGHADHIAVSGWITDAFATDAAPGATLYYATNTPAWAEEFVPELQKFDVFGPGTPPVTPVEDMAISVSLDHDLLELKLAAISEHVSQVEGMMNAFGADFFRRSMAEENYRLGARA